MIAWMAIYAGILATQCSYARASIYTVMYFACTMIVNGRMRLPEEKSSAKSTASVSGPHTKTAERIFKNSVLRQFLVTPQ